MEQRLDADQRTGLRMSLEPAIAYPSGNTRSPWANVAPEMPGVSGQGTVTLRIAVGMAAGSI